MAQLDWTLSASQEFVQVCDYFAIESPDYLPRFVRQVKAITEDIAKQPYFGPAVEEYDRDDIRERLCDSYRIVYRPTPQGAEILTIIHGARLLPRKPPI